MILIYIIIILQLLVPSIHPFNNMLRLSHKCLSPRSPKNNLFRLLSSSAVAIDSPLGANGADGESEGPDMSQFSHLTSQSPTSKANSVYSKNYPSLAWTSSFGSKNSTSTITHLKQGHPHYINVSNITAAGVCIVTSIEQAKIVVASLVEHGAKPNIFHACDTEVMNIDLKRVGPIGNGFVTCFSMYSGPDFDYGLGGGPGQALWVDNLDESEGVMDVFKDFFESSEYKKVWHNYGFDRHVMFNEGIDCMVGDDLQPHSHSHTSTVLKLTHSFQFRASPGTPCTWRDCKTRGGQSGPAGGGMGWRR